MIDSSRNDQSVDHVSLHIDQLACFTVFSRLRMILRLILMIAMTLSLESKFITHESAHATPRDDSKSQRRVAVLDFRDEASLPLFERAALADSVRGAALNTPLIVMTKENMVALLPPGTDLASCVDDCEVEVGRSIGAHYIITGMIGRVDQKLQLLLRLYETRSGSLKAQSTISASTVGTLQPEVRRAALQMLTKLSPSLQLDVDEHRTLLFIRTRASNAKILLDGYPIPKARRRVSSGGFIIPVKPGKHEVKAKARGYISKKVSVSVREGEPVEADMRLKRRGKSIPCHTGHCKADVFVYTKPPNARIFVDGVDTGLVTKPSSMNPKLGSTALRLTPGKHWISAKRSPFDEATRLITVDSGDLYNGFRDDPLILSRARGHLNITSEPSGAIVRLNGQVVGKTPFKKRNLLTRPYWVELITEGFQSREELIKVERGRTKKLNWKLTSSTADLQLSVSYKRAPVIGASVWLDDEKLGETNEEGILSLSRVTTGDHHLQVRHPLYTADGESITLKAGKKTKKHFRMRGAFAYLSVDTSSLEEDLKQWTAHQRGTGGVVESNHQMMVLWGGSQLKLDQRAKTEGRHEKIKVSAGHRWLQVRPPNGAEAVFAPSSQRIDLKVGAHLTVKPIWKRHQATLQLRSPKTKSQVLVDEKIVGVTPLSRRLETGPHTIELRAQGYVPYRKLIWLTQEGLKSEVNFDERTTLAVNCSPLQGIVDIDGLVLGPSPQTVDVKPGSHLITCLAQGAEVHRRVELSPGERLNEQLTISDELLGAAYNRRKYWRQGSALVGLGSALIIATGVVTLTTALPQSLASREDAQSKWVAELDPVRRLDYANRWAQADTEAKNMSRLGWSTVGLGVTLGLSSAISWWLHQE